MLLDMPIARELAMGVVEQSKATTSVTFFTIRPTEFIQVVNKSPFLTGNRDMAEEIRTSGTIGTADTSLT